MLYITQSSNYVLNILLYNSNTYKTEIIFSLELFAV